MDDQMGGGGIPENLPEDDVKFEGPLKKLQTQGNYIRHSYCETGFPVSPGG